MRTILGAVALWLLTWGLVGVSIVVTVTSEEPAGAVDAVVQSVGGFYLTTVRALQQFATATTVSPRWVDIAHAALAPGDKHRFDRVRLHRWRSYVWTPTMRCDQIS